jgi:hypothetical protein
MLEDITSLSHVFLNGVFQLWSSIDELDRGSTIRRQTGTPWLVLHHVPPKSGPVVSGEEREASDLLLTWHERLREHKIRQMY